jgi:predicted lipoprotein with Yx(FWY)xxD motif
MIDGAGQNRWFARWRLGGIGATALAIGGLALVTASAPAATRHLTLKSEHVTALKARVLAAPTGLTLYRLKPETSHHLLCKTACLQFWRPLTVSSKSEKVRLPRGMHGHTHLLKRGHKFQVTLGSDPLYTFSGDSHARQANGQGIKSFGGTWLTFTVKKDAAASPAPAPMPGPYPTY